MKINDFARLRSCGVVNVPTSHEKNTGISMTDPTQACPVKNVYEALVNGRPLDISEHENIYNGVKVDDLSSIEKRHCDRFDVHIESKKIGKKFSKVASMVVPAKDEKNQNN